MKRGRVFHLTSRGLTVQRWRSGRLCEAFAFTNDRRGRDGFESYLGEEPDEPALLLVDLVEEEFVTETLPHARGRERRQLHARRAERLFRETPLRAGLLLGRAEGGRRDDRVLFSALTNPGTVMPWVERMVDHAVPLRAISSMPHVCGALPRALGLVDDELLIVLFEEQGLRQCYFQQGELRVSRLSAAAGEADAIMAEIGRTRRYLEKGGLAPAITLPVYLIGEPPLIEALEKAVLPAGAQLHLCDVGDVARRIGIEGAPGSIAALFGGLFLRHGGNVYAQPVHLRAAYLHMTRRAVELGGLAMAILLCLFALAAATEALLEQRAGQEVRNELAMQMADSRRIKEVVLPDGLTAERLRGTVEEAERLARIPMTPAQVLSTVGRQLNGRDEFHLRRIDWVASLDPAFSDISPAGAGEVALKPPLLGGEDGTGRPCHVVTLEGSVASSSGELRRTLGAMEQFFSALKGIPGASRTELLERPVDPAGTLRGTASANAAGGTEFPFALRVVVRP